MGLARGFWKEILWDCLVEKHADELGRYYELELEGVDEDQWKDERCVIYI